MGSLGEQKRLQHVLPCETFLSAQSGISQLLPCKHEPASSGLGILPSRVEVSLQGFGHAKAVPTPKKLNQ
jgi:hypothetical protein